MNDESYTIRVPKRWARGALIVVVTALVVAPLTAVATHSFNDVPNDSTFHNDIAAIADAGVTRGCNPPTNTLYCPNDNVTREQMAAFMNRLGALGPDQTPVVNAATALEAAHANRADGLAEVQRVVDTGAPVNLSEIGANSHSVSCPEGFVATGGGSYSSQTRVLVEDSRPTADGTGWQVLYRNMRGSAVNHQATVYAVCIQADDTVVATLGLDPIDEKDQ